jgi:hypothetical protein
MGAGPMRNSFLSQMSVDSAAVDHSTRYERVIVYERGHCKKKVTAFYNEGPAPIDQRDWGMVFYQVFHLSPLQRTLTNCRNCKRLRKFEEIFMQSCRGDSE